jgi:hypothetical protein
LINQPSLVAAWDKSIESLLQGLPSNVQAIRYAKGPHQLQDQTHFSHFPMGLHYSLRQVSDVSCNLAEAFETKKLLIYAKQVTLHFYTQKNVGSDTRAHYSSINSTDQYALSKNDFHDSY